MRPRIHLLGRIMQLGAKPFEGLVMGLHHIDMSSGGNTMQRIGRCTIITLLLLAIAALAWGALPQTINYQGYLRNTDGTPVNSQVSVVFSLYAAASGGSALWTEPQSVTPANGVYSVQLGSLTAFPVNLFANNDTIWLGIKVEHDPEMTPRQQLTSVPYALKAATVDTVPSTAINGTLGILQLPVGTTAGTVASGSDPRLTDARSPTAGSAFYIQNQTASAQIADFNVSGTGTVGGNLTVGGSITGDGSGLTNVQKKYGKTAVVAQSGGDYTSPLTAMTGIAFWCGVPSVTNPCLLKIMPGVYDIGAGTLAMASYVDIDGSGENTTVITGAVGNASIPLVNGVVNGADNAEIRFLTIRNTGTGSYVGAMVNTGVSPKISNITLNASGGTNTNYGIASYSSSAPVMTNVTATASGGNTSRGVYNQSAAPVMMNITATASGGATYNTGVYNNTSAAPVMTNVTATASGGQYNHGVVNYSSSPTMTNVIATASGGYYNYGINNNSSSLTMTNVTATASGGAASNYGLFNYALSASYVINIDRSTFSGATNSIANNAYFTLRIGASKLAGGAANTAGNYTCVGSYNDSYTALDNTCQ